VIYKHVNKICAISHNVLTLFLAMKFLFPLASLGLLTLPLILLLHILRDRYQQLPVTSLALWYGLQQKRRGSHFRNLPLTLMLCLQLGIAISLALSLARPAMSFLVDYPQQVIFIIDTTTSMLAQSDSGFLTRIEGLNPVNPVNPLILVKIDAARAMLKAQIESLEPPDSFAIINLKAKPEILFTGEVNQKAQALSILNNLTAGATGLDLPAALTLANGLFIPRHRHKIVILTDGNFELTKLTELTYPVNPLIMVITSPKPLSNQALLNVSAYTLPDKQHRIFARVVNYSDQSVERTLQISTSGNSNQQSKTIQLAPQDETTQIWTLPTQTESATIEIMEADALPQDNRAQLWLAEPAPAQVLLISKTPTLLAKVLHAQPNIKLTIAESFPTMNQGVSQNFDLTILDSLTTTLYNETAWPTGHLLIVNPQTADHAPLMRRVKPDPATAATWLHGLDFSGVYFKQITAITIPTWAEVDLGINDLQLPPSSTPNPQSPIPNPLIFHGQVGQRRVMVWAFNPTESNLPARLAFPLLMNNTMSMLLWPSLPKVILAGTPISLEQGLTIELPDGRRLTHSFATQTNFDQTQQPGLYKIYYPDQRWGGALAVHAGSALESNLHQFQASRQTSEVLKTSEVSTATSSEIYELWAWLAGLALIIILLEGWLAWTP